MKLIVTESSGWDEKAREENCLDIKDALVRISEMIEDGGHAGNDSPLGWDWELHEEE